MGLFGKKKDTGESLTLSVEGMTCGHCAMKVTKALEGVGGVKKARVDLGKKQAVVEYTGEVDKDALVKAVDDAGAYTATLA